MYKLKNVAKRGSALLGALGLLTGISTSMIPALASADALNPLTERSLTLSSSSPGWSHTDGSGNEYASTVSAGYSPYAAPNTGANGQKTGETISFRVSSGATIKAFDAQYCTTPAGNCIAPGNDATHGTDIEGGTSAHPGNGTSDFKFTDTSGTDTWAEATTDYYNAGTLPDPSTGPGQYEVLTSPAAGGGTSWTQDPGWILRVENNESPTTTGQNNYFILAKGDGTALDPGEYVKIVFYATVNGYITNPGEGAFYARLDTYSHFGDGTGTTPDVTSDTGDATNLTVGSANVVDGGVTVANVMNESINIQTKVLETMQFSVGTVDPDTLSGAQGGAATSATTGDACAPILTSAGGSDSSHNTLSLGDPDGDYSLDPNKTFATHSFFRLSTNSAKGATVYYSGVSLTDTEGDVIDPIGTTPSGPIHNKEQFGLALDNQGDTGHYSISYVFAPNLGDTVTESGDDETAQGIASPDYATGGGTVTTTTAGTAVTGTGTHFTSELQPGATIKVAGGAALTVASITDDTHLTLTAAAGADNADAAYTFNIPGLSTDWLTFVANSSNNAKNPGLYPLVPEAAYGNPLTGQGSGLGAINGTPDTEYAFDPTSNTIPAPLATEGNQVLDCVTGKVRYIADIAPTTPAGIYTTKINYVAAPKY